MAEIKVYNQNAEECGSLTLNDKVFGAEYNEPLIHEVVVAYLANQRQGTKSTLTRSEVRGHAKKPYRQKHTGRARHGSTKAVQWVGGGIAFAPKPRDFSKKVNKQAKKSAFISAISTKLANNEITVIQDFKLEEAKTKLMQKVLDNFKFDRSTILVTKGKDETAMIAGANIPYLTITTSDLLNTYEVVANKNVLLTVDAVKDIEEAYKR